MPVSESKREPLDHRLLRRLLAYARPHARGFILSTFLLIGMAAITLAIPSILGTAVDRYLVGQEALALDHEDRMAGIRSAGLIIFLLGAGSFVCRISQITVTNHTGQKVIHDLRMAVYSHITRRDLRFFDRNPVGTLVTRVTGDIETLNEFFVSGVDVLFSDLIRVSAITVLLFLIDWQMALATLAAVPFILLWAFVFQRRTRRLFHEVRGHVSDLNAYMNEALSGIQVVHAFGQEAGVEDQFRGLNRNLRDAHIKTVRNFSWFFPGMEVITALGMSAVLVTGYFLSVGGDLAPGDVVKFWLYLSLFIEPLRQLADKYNILQAAVAAGNRVFNVLDTHSRLPVVDHPLPLTDAHGHVQFDDVSFAYDARQSVLQDVSFEVPPGSHLAVVGPTGSGKSTIINLLCRFYDPQAGRILLDGKDLRDLDPGAIRQRVGVVLQDVFLFQGTVRDNLTLGVDSLADAALTEALRAVQAEAVVERIGGLDGLIKERGATLSTGEKQLLAFARTLAHDPVLLVLDEATAHIDTETELLLQEALARLMEGRTCIVIAHRLSTIQNSDRILVLQHGRIREAGTHAELLAKDGLYACLYRLQFQDEPGTRQS